MTKHEHELNDFLIEQKTQELSAGWKAGAATPERVSSLIERLSTRNKLRMAAIAINSASQYERDDIDFVLQYEEAA